MKDSNRVSIITVSYNAEAAIRKTIESVLCQTYSNIEYIIVDGKSTDTTYQIICEYDKAFQCRNIPYIHISEPDKGIYDAMNKALDYCSGDWIYYLNANDRLFRDVTLEKVFSKKYAAEISCIYGNTWNVKGEKVYFKPAYDIKVIYYKAPFVHQALFVRRGIMRQYRFNINYRISADYDLFVRMYVNGEKYMQIDCDIAFFDLSGVSQTGMEEAKKEWTEIQKENGLYRHYWVRRFWRNQIVLPLKKNKLIYKIYFCYMYFRNRNE